VILPLVSRSALLSLFHKMLLPSATRQGGVQYKMGGKVDWGIWRIKGGLEGDSNLIRRIDCSGWSRYGAAKASGQRLVLPDGSWAQNQWCEAEGLQRVEYKTVSRPQSERLYIAFIPIENSADGSLHVWFVLCGPGGPGTTLESHGRAGIHSRAWDTPVLLREVGACYVLPSIA
jgi:hypothetical protein